MNHESSHSSGIHIHSGISSILLIFIILCLVSFAALSLSSANADWKLTKKMLTRTTAYYNACNEAEDKLVQIDQTLSSLYASSASEDVYYESAGKTSTFEISISDTQNLEISLNYLYPATKDGPFYRITSWQVKTDTSSMDYNESLPVPK